MYNRTNPIPLHDQRPPKKAPKGIVTTDAETSHGEPTPRLKDPKSITGRGFGRLSAKDPTPPLPVPPGMNYTPWKPKGRKEGMI